MAVGNFALPVSTGGSAGWTPPSDWIDISSVGENEINILVGDGIGIGFYANIANDGTYSVDWGDGTIEHLFISEQVAEHNYVYGSGQMTSDGSSVYKIRIFNATDNITKWTTAKTTFYLSQQEEQNYLWVVFGTNFIEDFTGTFYDVNSSVPIICPFLQAVTLPDLTYCTNMSAMFMNCSSLQSVTFPNSWGGVLLTSSLFRGCKSLHYFNLPNSWGVVTSVEAMFQGCTSLSDVVLPNDWGNVLYTNSMFSDSVASSITLPDSWGGVQFTDQMFSNCTINSLKLPATWGQLLNATNLFNTSKVQNVVIPSDWYPLTSIEGMFSGCSNLKELKLPSSWGTIEDATSLFAGTGKLSIIDMPSDFNDIGAASLMFSYSENTPTIIISDWHLTAASSMFDSCTALVTLTLPSSFNSLSYLENFLANLPILANLTFPTDFGAVSGINGILSYCSALTEFTFPSTWGMVSTINKGIDNCANLTTVTLPSVMGDATVCKSLLIDNANLEVVTNTEYLGSINYDCDFSYLISNCRKITSPIVIASRIDRIDIIGNENTAQNSLITSIRLTNQDSGFYGYSPEVNVSYNSLSQAALETLFLDLPNNLPGKTIYISGNPGVGTEITKAISTTAGSDTVLMITGGVTNLDVGMQMYIPSGSINVTLQDTGDTVTLNDHGFSDGKMISFSAIGSTSGINTNTLYYVINSTLNTFQIAASAGGAVIPLVGNGTAVLEVAAIILSKTEPNTITVDMKMRTSTSTGSYFRALKTSYAYLKGWIVSF